MKSRDMTLLTKVRTVKVIVFPVVTYGCESWTKKKQNAKELMPLNCGAGENSWKSLGQQGDQTSQSSGRSALDIHWKEWSWSWNFHLMWRDDSLKSPWSWERLRAEGEEGVTEWDGLDSITNAMNMNLGKLRKMVRDREPWHAAIHGVAKSHMTGQLNNKLQSSGHS